MKEKRKSQAPDTRTQAQKFIDTARELGCDENEAAFEAELKRIAPAEPEAGKINP
jgi:hypothetical protein